MILTGREIANECAQGKIEIEPFSEAQVNPNSYDFRLGPTLKTYVNHVLDVRIPNLTSSLEIPDSGFILSPDKIYLGHSIEIIGSDYYVPIIRAKSSIARLGLFVHVTADLIDIGSHGQITVQLHAVQPVRIYPSMRIGQVTFWKVAGEIVLYNGKYQNSRGPQESMVYRDFEHLESLGSASPNIGPSLNRLDTAGDHQKELDA
jgi:dCTP deaminase